MRPRRLLLVAMATHLAVGCSLALDADDYTRGSPDAASGDSGASPPPDAQASPCPDGGAVRCYFALAEPQTQTQAVAACSAVGAHLVTISSAAEQAAVEAVGGGEARWIGLAATKAPPTGAQDFAWLTGEPTTYENWLPGNPSDNESCVVITTMHSERWVDRPCEDRYRPICEYDPEARPAGER